MGCFDFDSIVLVLVRGILKFLFGDRFVSHFDGSVFLKFKRHVVDFCESRTEI